MKKIICMVLVLSILAVFGGCGAENSGKTRIAVVQQLDHSSLDEIRTALVAELAAHDVEVEIFNGQTDPSVLNQIGAQVVADGFDAIVPIASLAAQCMVTAADGMDIPVVCAAVSDPETAGLTGMPLVTGTADVLNTALILDMMLAADPDVRTVGLLYSNSEPNSARPVAQARELLQAKGIDILEKTGNTADEVLAAASSLVGRVDAVFTPTDNVVMNVAGAVADILTSAGIPHYTGADSFVTSGAFATCGTNYTELGTQTARMVLDVLETGKAPEFQVLAGDIITCNTDTAQALNLDTGVFASLAETVREVVTAG